jgi:hypothetical protein
MLLATKTVVWLEKTDTFLWQDAFIYLFLSKSELDISKYTAWPVFPSSFVKKVVKKISCKKILKIDSDAPILSRILLSSGYFNLDFDSQNNGLRSSL